MILIINAIGGLCNQVQNIISSIMFCKKYNLKYSFKNALIRKQNLLHFESIPFNNFFEHSYFLKDLNYIDFNLLKSIIDKDNSISINYPHRTNLKKNDEEIYKEIISYDKEFVIISNMMGAISYIKMINIVNNKIPLQLYPINEYINIYERFKINFLPENYNFIHYRFESDFQTYMKCQKKKLDNLSNIINKINFKNNYKIYVACSFEHLNDEDRSILMDDKFITKENFYKNNDLNLNYEVNAWIDLLIGYNSKEVYGHSNSSFSEYLNLIKSSSNYYNLLVN